MIKYEEAVAFLGLDRYQEIREGIVEDVVSKLGAEQAAELSKAISLTMTVKSRVESLLLKAVITEALKEGFPCEKSNVPPSTTATTD